MPKAESNSNPTPASVPPVVLHDITRQFGRFAALRAVSATFAGARLYAILGDNGAGKSTLLRIMAGLLPPTRGTVTMLGTTKLRSVCDQVGYMAHAPLLYDELDAMENLRYFAGLYGICDDPRCAAAIARVGLDPALKRRVGQYSQGMRQRVSLARAVLHDPSILLLDEPFSNVDITSAREMVRLLVAMRDGVTEGKESQKVDRSNENPHPSLRSGWDAPQGKTIFVVTHQPSLLDGVADEFVWMAQGRIVARTTELAQGPAHVVSRPTEVMG